MHPIVKITLFYISFIYRYQYTIDLINKCKDFFTIGKLCFNPLVFLKTFQYAFWLTPNVK